MCPLTDKERPTPFVKSSAKLASSFLKSPKTLEQALSALKLYINSADDEFKDMGLNVIESVKREVENAVKNDRVQDFIVAMKVMLSSVKNFVNSQEEESFVPSLLESFMPASGTSDSHCTMCTIITKEFLASLRSSETAVRFRLNK